jgi:hypothetical protein
MTRLVAGPLERSPVVVVQERLHPLQKTAFVFRGRLEGVEELP